MQLIMVLKNLINYLNANQGAIYLYNDTDPEYLHLEQILVETQCKLVRLCGLIRMGLNQFKSLP